MTRRIIGGTWCLAAALVLGGCGIFGDSDALPTAVALPTEEPAEGSVRITYGDRWVELRLSDVGLSPGQEPDESAIAELGRRILDLGVERREPVDAGVDFDGLSFLAVDGVGGQEPDPSTLARELLAAGSSGSAVEVPFRPIEPAVPLARAQAVADELNSRTAAGLRVAVAGTTGTIPLDVLGSATSVDLTDGGYSVTVRWRDLDDYVASIFSDTGQPGGEASFTVREPEIDGAPPEVVLVPAAPARVCCDERSASRIAAALEHDIEIARLYLRSEDGVRGNAWAKSLGITEHVGTFTTRYTPGQSRVTNIRRIAELVQGAIIEPGGTFSLNGHVGRRTTEKGFVPAGTIVNGHLVESVGGGISQFATTIFNAAFFAGLEFDTYQSHSIYFSRYPYGREATVSWPNPDLRIHNPSPHGVLIWPTTTASSVTVDLYSTRWAVGEQTDQWERQIQVACTRVTTERTRTFVDDGRTETDTVFATYRPEGIACDGTETQNPDEEQIEKLEDGEDPGFDNGTTTTTTVAPTTTTTTTVAPTTTTSSTTSTTSTTSTVAPTTTTTTTSTTTSSTTTTTSSTTSTTTTTTAAPTTTTSTTTTSVNP